MTASPDPVASPVADPAIGPPAGSALDAFYPSAFSRLRIDWRHLNIAGPPTAFALTPNERGGQDCEQRYGRRTIQCLSLARPEEAGGGHDRIAFIDKAIPHARLELMAGEVGVTPKATAADVGEPTLQFLLQAAREFATFVSEPEVMRRYQLTDGLAHLALNCDPNTLDRESIQAVKHFHLHFIYWTGDELAALGHDKSTLPEITDPGLRQRVLDPLMPLAARILHHRLSRLDLGPGAELLPFEDLPSGPTEGLLGCLIRVPGWATLTDPACGTLLRRIHHTIDGAGSELLAAFTGHREPPAAWRRHPLRPLADIGRAIDALDYPPACAAALKRLAATLRPLSPAAIARLRRRPQRRIRHLSLNLPCYALNLHSPLRNRPARGRRLIDADAVYLMVQPKLFSAVGGAGSLALGGIPSVHVRRGQGAFSDADWQQRADFQREFLVHLQATVREFAEQPVPPVRRLRSFAHGWR